MPIDSQHPQYRTMIDTWRKCRWVVEGEQSVKSNPRKFVPMLSGQDYEEYQAYVDRAAFFPATKRTVEGITGAAFFRDPTIDGITETYKETFKSVGADGQPLNVFSKMSFREVFSTGRYGILVDIDEAAPADVLPYFAGYATESIINWRVGTLRGGREVIEMVVLEEKGFLESEDDRFEYHEYTRYLLLELVEGVYHMTTYRKVKRRGDDGQEKEVIEVERPTFAPTLRGRTLDEIPFVFIGPTSPTPNIEDPPVLDLVSVNIGHFRNSADLEHGLHFTALPTAWVSGFKLADGETLRIGSATAWVVEEPGASAGFLEFSGNGLRAIESAMDRKEKQMVVLGTRLLQEEKLASEAAETLMIKKSAEVSVIGALINSVEAGIQKAITLMANWSGIMGDNQEAPRITINKEFMSSVINESSLVKLLSLLQSNAISYETFFWNLRRSGFVPEESTYAEELSKIGQKPEGITFAPQQQQQPGGGGALPMA